MFSPEPRDLSAAECATWTCPRPDCELPAASGTHRWDDRGPHQMISRHTLTCPDGHTWHHDTDGG